MWNESRLSNGAVIYHRVHNDVFEVNCPALCGDCDKKLVLVAVNKDNSPKTEMCVGSFSEKNGMLIINKSYTGAYVRFHDIDADSVEFRVDDSEGNTLFKTYDDSKDSEEETEDYSVRRARELTEHEYLHEDFSNEAEKAAFHTSLICNGYEKADLKCFKGYTWYRIKNINEDFCLSSVRHLTDDRDFVYAYSGSGEWFFGKSDNRLLAVCVESKDEASPFANAEDCSVFQKINDKFYHAVGIALLNDGQYFYRIESM